MNSLPLCLRGLPRSQPSSCRALGSSGLSTAPVQQHLFYDTFLCPLSTSTISTPCPYSKTPSQTTKGWMAAYWVEQTPVLPWD